MAKRQPAKTRGGSSSPSVSAKWQKILRLIPGYDPFESAPDGTWFDEAKAQEVVDFFTECIVHIEGDLAGEPFILEPWQQAIVGNLFGWLMVDHKGRTVRRYRKCLLLVPRKSGKTPLVAGIALYVFFCDPEQGQQNYVAASSKDQAGLLFRQAKGMVEREPIFKDRCQVYGGNAPAGQSRSLVMEDDGSFLRVISGEDHGSHGKNSHLILIDELHEQKNRDLIDSLTTSMASDNRAQPLLIYLTTSDFDRPSICNEVVDFAHEVRDKKIGQRFLPVIYEALPTDDWEAESTWEKANPNIDVSVSRDYLRAAVEEAKSKPALINTFKRLHLNIRTQNDECWLSLPQWDACNRGHFAIDGRACWIGLDLASTLDIAALSAIFRRDPVVGPDGCERDGGWDLWCRFWVPETTLYKRAQRDGVEYLTYRDQQYLTATPGDTIDYRTIYGEISDLVSRCRVVKIGIDPWNAEEMCQNLIRDGLEVEKFHPGMAAMSGPTKEFDRLVSAGLLNHAGNPVLRWMAGNAYVEVDGAENMRPVKAKSTEKIDGIISSILAVGVASMTPEPEECVYESRGFRSLG